MTWREQAGVELGKREYAVMEFQGTIVRQGMVPTEPKELLGMVFFRDGEEVAAAIE